MRFFNLHHFEIFKELQTQNFKNIPKADPDT